MYILILYNTLTRRSHYHRRRQYVKQYELTTANVDCDVVGIFQTKNSKPQLL